MVSVSRERKSKKAGHLYAPNAVQKGLSGPGNIFRNVSDAGKLVTGIGYENMERSLIRLEKEVIE